MTDTQMLDKISAVRNESQAIGEFLDYLREQGIRLCRWRTDLTDWRPCCGVGRDGRPRDNIFGDDNCDDGVVKRAVKYLDRRTKDVVMIDAGATCPACDGEGGKVIKASEQWVEESSSTEDILAAYYGIDRQAAERERRAVLDVLDHPSGPDAETCDERF